MNLLSIVDNIIKEAVGEDEQQQVGKPKQKVVHTSVPVAEIHAAREVAAFCREKLQSLVTDVNLAISDLNGKEKPSVLNSKDDFKSLFFKMKTLKRKLSAI
jgi:hypothetical protein